MCGILAVLGVRAKGGAESVMPEVLERARRLRHRGQVRSNKAVSHRASFVHTTAAQCNAAQRNVYDKRSNTHSSVDAATIRTRITSIPRTAQRHVKSKPTSID